MGEVRRKKIRLPASAYEHGWYFVTICTQARMKVLAQIRPVSVGADDSVRPCGVLLTPLGSIVRKGGLGMPIVISVILFIIYYILNNVGYKMARDGVWIHWIGMWFSSMILLPLGVFLTYKAMTDSVIMTTDTYVGFFRKLFFIREKRNYTIKDVVIEEPDNNQIVELTNDLDRKIEDYLTKYGYLRYATYWKSSDYGEGLNGIKSELEDMLNQLSNSRNPEIIDSAKKYPVLIKHVRPFGAGTKIAKILYYTFPVGLAFKLISIPFERRIKRDLNLIVALNKEVRVVLSNLQNKIAV